MAVLGLAAASGIALAAGADSTRTTPAPVPARSVPAAGCLADIECYGESELVLNKPAAPNAVPQAPAPEQDGPTSTPAD